MRNIVFIVLSLILTINIVGCRKLDNTMLTNEEIKRIVDNLPDNSDILKKIIEKERQKEIERKSRKPKIENEK